MQIPITKIPAIEVLCRDGAGVLISLEDAVDLTASQGIARRLSVVAVDLSQSPAAGKALDPEGVSGHYKNLGVGRGELHLERRVDGFAVVHLNGCVIQSHPLDEETVTVEFVIDRKSVMAQCTGSLAFSVVEEGYDGGEKIRYAIRRPGGRGSVWWPAYVNEEVVVPTLAPGPRVLMVRGVSGNLALREANIASTMRENLGEIHIGSDTLVSAQVRSSDGELLASEVEIAWNGMLVGQFSAKRVMDEWGGNLLVSVPSPDGLTARVLAAGYAQNWRPVLQSGGVGEAQTSEGTLDAIQARIEASPGVRLQVQFALREERVVLVYDAEGLLVGECALDAYIRPSDDLKRSLWLTRGEYEMVVQQAGLVLYERRVVVGGSDVSVLVR